MSNKYQIVTQIINDTMPSYNKSRGSNIKLEIVDLIFGEREDGGKIILIWISVNMPTSNSLRRAIIDYVKNQFPDYEIEVNIEWQKID